MVRHSRWLALVPLLMAGTAYAVGVTTDSVAESLNVSSPGGAVGSPVAGPGSNFGDDITPFTPAFDTTVVVGNATSSTPTTQAASITLHFAQPVVPAPGKDIGVFTNVGLSAAYDPTVNPDPITGLTAAPGPILFSTVPQMAIVSVSTDNVGWVALNGGNPINLAEPSNQFLDSVLDPQASDFGPFVDAGGGTQLSDPYKPFTGSLTDFSGETYPQMLATLNGSFGGAWIDASGTGLSAINYIRFDVPNDVNYRLVLDAVTAVSTVPEPASLAIGSLALCLLARRRRKA